MILSPPLPVNHKVMDEKLTSCNIGTCTMFSILKHIFATQLLISLNLHETVQIKKIMFRVILLDP